MAVARPMVRGGGRMHPSAVASRMGGRPAAPAPAPMAQPPVPGSASALPGSQGPGQLATMRGTLLGGSR